MALSKVKEVLGMSVARRGIMLMLVATLGAAVVLAALLFLSSASPSHAAVIQRAKQVWSQEGIVHALFHAPNGAVFAEEWLKKSTNETRRVEHNGGPGGDTITVQNGSRITHWSTVDPATTATVMETYDANDPWLEDSSTLLRFGRMLERGRAHVAGETVVKGRPAWLVIVDVSAANSTPDVKAEIALDKETLLPLTLTSTLSGRTETVDIETEEQSESSLSSSFFSSDLEPKIRDTRLRFSDLRRFTAFPVYSLGQAYGGLKAGAPMLEEQRPMASDAFEFQPHVSLGYTRSGPYGEHVIDLTEQPAGTEQVRAELPSYEASGLTRSVSIEGKVRKVFFVKADEQSISLTAFAVELDGTLVSGRATMSVEDIATMLSNLQRMN